MAYVDAIANAIGARGNALAQGALQSGQVWGSLAANLGQIPGQAIAFHQQRQDALQNHELKKMALEKAQRKAGIEKEAIRIVNSDLPEEQMIAELERVASSDPEEFVALQRFKSQRAIQQQQLEVAKAQRDFTMRSGLPGTQFEHQITPPPANALAPGEMAPQVPMPQRQMEFEKMVHPMNQFGIRPPTDVDVRERQAATDALAMKKYAEQQTILESDREKLAGVKAGLLKDKPLTAADTDIRMEGGKPVTYQFNPATQRFDIKVGEARPQMSMMPGAGQPQSQFAGTQDGRPVAFVPQKGGPGKIVQIPGLEGGPIRPKTLSTGEAGKTSDIENSEQKVVNLKTMYDPSFVGPIAGRWEQFKMGFPGVSIDPNVAKFYAANANLKNEVIKFTTGAAVGVQEEQRILAGVPVITDKPEVWEAKYDLTLENIRTLKQKMAEAGLNFGGGGGTAPPAGENLRKKYNY